MKTANLSPRPRLLVSVRDADEVMAALEGGADWIDLKEPLAGPLGAVDAEVAIQVVERVAGHKPVSAALGELLDWPDSPSRSLLEIEGISVVKLGLAGCKDRDDWQSLWQAAAALVCEFGKTLVAVAYADWHQAQSPPPKEVIAYTQANQCRFFLIDTFDKQNGTVFDHLSTLELQEILALAKSASIQSVIAGSLAQNTLAELPSEGIDLVAVRGAVCAGERTETICQVQVAEFCKAVANRWP